MKTKAKHLAGVHSICKGPEEGAGSHVRGAARSGWSGSGTVCRSHGELSQCLPLGVWGAVRGFKQAGTQSGHFGQVPRLFCGW